MKAPRRALAALIVLAVVALAAWLLRPAPVAVEVARAERGRLLVTVDEEGKTRVRQRFVLDSPVTGQIERITLEAGDAVKKGDVLARVYPSPLDPRARTEARARVDAAEASRRQAAALVQKARAALAQSRRNEERYRRLTEAGTVSRQQGEQAALERTTDEKDLEAALFSLRAAEFQAEAARAALLEPSEGVHTGDDAAVTRCETGARGCIALRSPIDGRVLRLLQESERVVGSGEPLLELGDPASMEIVVDVLSADAVKVRPGAPVLLENWGGENPLEARVRTVEPSGFTKVSALGVEEQRVNVVADFVDPPPGLGDGFRLEARIVVWEGKDVLKVPTSAIFRRGSQWNVFVAASGRARRRDVSVGHLGDREVEVTAGLRPGEAVILHPGDRVDEGVRVSASR